MSIYSSIYFFNMILNIMYYIRYYIDPYLHICHTCDILQPSICPHISLASPWSVPSNLSIDLDLREVEEERELLLLRIGNISLIVTGHP